MNIKRIYEPIRRLTHKILRPKCHINPIQNSGKERLKFGKELTEDVFESTNTSSLKLLAQYDLNSYINKKFLLGEGAQGAVYKIGDTPYVLKIPHKEILIKGIIRGESVDMSKLSFFVTPQDKVCNVVGHIGDAQILNYIEGKNTISDLSSSEKEISNAINNLSIDNIKGYLYKLVKANRVGRKHDYFGNNCIINCTTGELTPIDFMEGQDFKILNSLMAQCSHIRGEKAKNTLLVKGVIAILEMARDRKIMAKEVEIDGDVFKLPGLHYLTDKKFTRYMKRLCNSFTQDSSSENIDKLLTELKSL